MISTVLCGLDGSQDEPRPMPQQRAGDLLVNTSRVCILCSASCSAVLAHRQAPKCANSANRGGLPDQHQSRSASWSAVFPSSRSDSRSRTCGFGLTVSDSRSRTRGLILLRGSGAMLRHHNNQGITGVAVGDHRSGTRAAPRTAVRPNTHYSLFVGECSVHRRDRTYSVRDRTPVMSWETQSRAARY